MTTDRTDRGRGCDEIERLLTPYTDSELSAPERAAVETHADACRVCAGRLADERTARAVLRARRAALAGPAPESLRTRCVSALAGAEPRRPWVRRWVPLSVAATILLAVAGALVFTLTDPARVLAAEIAADHVKCFALQDTSATADPVEVANRWKATHGWTLPVVPSIPAEGLRLVGLRRCFSTEGSMAHLLYVYNDRRLSVFVWPANGSQPRTLDVLGHRAVIWSSSDRLFAVVGNASPPVIEQVAARVRDVAARGSLMPN